jgi:hypothetical protein
MSIITVAEYHELIEDYPELDTVCLDEVAVLLEGFTLTDCWE